MSRSPRAVLAAILAIYLILASLYALRTPLWQAPDEPAHFNFVQELATRGRLPRLQPGDYDQAYLDQIKARGFPPDLAIDGIRYEGHQPPLYYLLAAPLYLASQGWGVAGQVQALRLFGVLLGGGMVALLWASVRRIFPAQPQRAHVAAAFAALLPMHLAMMAAVNNDSLAELLIAVGMYRLLGHVQAPAASLRAWTITGVVVGLGLLAKFQAYILLPLAAAVWLWQALFLTRRRNGVAAGSTDRPIPRLLAWLIPALWLPLPWWVRNLTLYGGSDLLGLQQHDAIVSGQPRTLDWIAAFGWQAYAERLFLFTFQSFWGVFGWLGLFLDARIYALLALLTLFAGVGLAVWGRQHGAGLSAGQRRGLALLGLHGLIVLASFVWYNLSFVQHQGRYLFPALLPLSLAFALGLEGLFGAGGSRVAAGVAAALALILALAGLARGDLPGWGLMLTLAAACVLALRSRWQTLPWSLWAALALAGVAAVAVWALFGAIVPQL